MVYKKYTFLDNIPALYEELKTKSMKELAKELCEKHKLDTPGSVTWADTTNSLAGCIRFRVQRYLNDGQSTIKRERKHKRKASTQEKRL